MLQGDFLTLATALHVPHGVGDVSPAHGSCPLFIADIKNQSKFHSLTLWNTVLPSPNSDINSKQGKYLNGKCGFKPVPGVQYVPHRGAFLWIRKLVVTGAKAPHYPHPIGSLGWVPSESLQEAAALPEGQCWAFVCARSSDMVRWEPSAYLHIFICTSMKGTLEIRRSCLTAACKCICIFSSCLESSRFYQEELLSREKFWSSGHVTRCNTEPNSLHTCGLAAAVDCVPLHSRGIWIFWQTSSLNPFLKICNIGNFLCPTIKNVT